MSLATRCSAWLLPCSAALCLATLGCGRPLATQPTEPTLLLRDSKGWTLVRQPGWFAVQMPRAPEHGELETTSPAGGTLTMKQLASSSDQTSMAVCFAELLDFEDHDAMLASVRSSFEQRGAHVHNTHDVVVQGRDGVESELHLPPDSQLNPSAIDAIARVRVLLDQNRAYVLIGIEPVGTSNSLLPRFFDSFEFAPPPQPDPRAVAAPAPSR